MIAETTQEIEAYAAAVAAHLDDLPAGERSELLEDLVGHLVEVEADEGGPLTDRLGPPEAYAEELRASAGLGPAPRRARWKRRPTIPAGVRERAERFHAHPEVQASISGLRQARPAWWVLRGYLAVLSLDALLGRPVYSLTSFPFPRFSSSTALGLVVVAIAVVGSVWLGRRSDAGWERRISVAGNAVLGMLLLVVASHISSAANQAVAGWWQEEAWAMEDTSQGWLLGAEGQEITNLYAFGPDGQPLDRIRVYDQLGRPVSIVTEYAEGREIVTSYVLDADGRPVTNAFPQHQALRWPDEWGDAPPTMSAPFSSVAPLDPSDEADASTDDSGASVDDPDASTGDSGAREK